MPPLPWQIAVAALLGCRDPDPTPPPDPDTASSTPTGSSSAPETFEAPFLWAPLDLSAAVDLGHVPAAVPRAEQAASGPIALTEVGEVAGLGGSASGGGIYGVGLAFVDLDGDGWEDLVLINGEQFAGAWPSALWRNRGDGTFEDRSAASGLAAALEGRDGYSVAAADHDADGDVDLYVGTHPGDVLLVNAGDGTLADGTAAAGAGGPASEASSLSSKIVGFGDYDADGRLDLVSASETFVDPAPNAYVLRGGDGGRFEDVTAQTGVFAPEDGTPCAVMWSDHDADGFGDLIVWSDFGDPTANRVLLRSDGSGFVDVAPAVGWTGGIGAPMGIDAADIDRDGRLDYFVGDGGLGMLLVSSGPDLWVDATAAAGIATPNGWGLGFEDLDADGWWDLFVGQSGDYPHLVYRHLGTDPPTFEGTELAHGPLAIGNVPVAFADYDHDGDVDVAAGGTDGQPVALYRNDTDRGTNRWLEVAVDAEPVTGARGGVTARVVVAAGGQVWWRDVSGGASRGAQSAHTARFGLGQHTGADWVGVLWPDGRQVVARGVPGDARIVFADRSAEVQPSSR